MVSNMRTAQLIIEAETEVGGGGYTQIREERTRLPTVGNET